MIDDPKLFPFDAALENRKIPRLMKYALCDVHDTLEMAKKMFAQQQIQEYSAESLAILVQAVLDREKEFQRIEEELYRRAVAGEPI